MTCGSVAHPLDLRMHHAIQLFELRLVPEHDAPERGPIEVSVGRENGRPPARDDLIEHRRASLHGAACSLAYQIAAVSLSTSTSRSRRSRVRDRFDARTGNPAASAASTSPVPFGTSTWTPSIVSLTVGPTPLGV